MFDLIYHLHLYPRGPQCIALPRASNAVKTALLITPVLKSLHWLKLPERIHFKVPNLQLPAVLPAHIPSPTLHHPANPLYSIIILSHSFSTPSHFLSHVLQPSHIHYCTTSLE